MSQSRQSQKDDDHTRKQAGQAATAKTGKRSTQCVRVCFIFGAGNCVCVFVTVGRFLLCYWTGKRGRFVCLQSVFDLEPTIRGGAWKAKAMKNSSNCLDERELNL